MLNQRAAYCQDDMQGRAAASNDLSALDRTSIDPKQCIERAPPDQPCGEGHDSQIAPRRLGTDKRERQDTYARNNTQRAVNHTFIGFHDASPSSIRRMLTPPDRRL
jgi:hypothetical protein